MDEDGDREILRSFIFGLDRLLFAADKWILDYDIPKAVVQFESGLVLFKSKMDIQSGGREKEAAPYLSSTSTGIPVMAVAEHGQGRGTRTAFVAWRCPTCAFLDAVSSLTAVWRVYFTRNIGRQRPL